MAAGRMATPPAITVAVYFNSDIYRWGWHRVDSCVWGGDVNSLLIEKRIGLKIIHFGEARNAYTFARQASL